LAFALVSATYAGATSTLPAALPWILLVTALDLGATALQVLPGQRPAVVRRWSLALVLTAAACSGVAFILGGVATVPLALIPAYHAGLRFGRRGFGAAYLAAVSGLAAAELLTSSHHMVLGALGAWLLSVPLLGLLGAWSKSMACDAGGPSTAGEAVAIMQRLHDLADTLYTGFDAPAHGASVLEDLATAVPTDRSVVFVGGPGEMPVPVALRGCTRVPWVDTEADGVGVRLSPTVPVEVLRIGTDLGQRLALVALLCTHEGEVLGFVAGDRPVGRPFTPAELAAAARIARASAPELHAALLFGQLRARATLEERRRLAREVHDGVAQDLAALGYQIDGLRMRAAASGSELKGPLDGLRASVAATITDVRSHISELRMPERPETGLGSVVGAAVQSFGSVTGVSTTVSVTGTTRLEAPLELALHRMLLEVLADAQAGQATTASVRLRLRTAGSVLEVAHDGHSRLTDAQVAPPAALAPRLSVRVLPDGARGVAVVCAVLEPAVDGAAVAKPTAAAAVPATTVAARAG
jgi:signal transduction histidine kinase